MTSTIVRAAPYAAAVMTDAPPTRAPKSLALLAAVMIPVAAAQTTLIFPLDGAEGAAPGPSGFTIAHGDVPLTMTVHDIARAGFDSGALSDGTPWVYGIVAGGSATFTNPEGNYMTAIEFSFDQNVTLTQYTLGANLSSVTGATFDLAVNGGATSAGNSFDETPSSTVSIQGATLSIPAGQHVILTTNMPNESAFAEIQSFTLTYSPIPEPGTWTAIGGACAGFVAMLFRGCRRRQIE